MDARNTKTNIIDITLMLLGLAIGFNLPSCGTEEAQMPPPPAQDIVAPTIAPPPALPPSALSTPPPSQSPPRCHKHKGRSRCKKARRHG